MAVNIFATSIRLQTSGAWSAKQTVAAAAFLSLINESSTAAEVIVLSSDGTDAGEFLRLIPGVKPEHPISVPPEVVETRGGFVFYAKSLSGTPTLQVVTEKA